MRMRRAMRLDCVLSCNLPERVLIGIICQLTHRHPRRIRNDTVELLFRQSRSIAIADDKMPDAVASLTLERF